MAATGAKNICGCDVTPDLGDALVADLLTAIKALPSSPDTREFEKGVYELLRTQFDEKNRSWLDVCQALNAVIAHRADPRVGEDHAYAALYALFTRARRENRLDLCESLLKGNEELAGTHASYHHMWAMLHSSRRTGDDLDNALDRARSALDVVKDHIGFGHSFAEIVALRAEAEQTKKEDPEFKRALDLAKKAVRAEGTYAKFHATVGRLMAVRGSLAEAEGYVRQALCREFGNWDSNERRVEYKGILTQIQLERQRKAISEEIESVKRHADETKTKHVEILGVFAGILALVLAGMAGLFQSAPEDISKASVDAFGKGILLMMLGGTILIAFGGLGVSVHEKRTGPTLAILLGVALFAVAAIAAWIISGGTLGGFEAWRTLFLSRILVWV
jgi:tetratricopeptide (TPR) repeat protein